MDPNSAMALAMAPEMGRVSFLESDSGQDKDALQPDQDDKQKQQKRPQSACVRCRFRHTRCPGGMPCSKCQMAKTNCEYVMHEKRLVVSRKYIYKLQDDISRLKKENAALRRSLRGEQAKKHHPSHPTPHATNAQLADMQVQPHIDFLGRTGVLPPAEDTEVIRPSLDKHGRLIQSRTGEKVYVGSSSMTLFGLEIQNMAPALPSSKFLNADSRVSSPSDSPGSQASFSHLGFDSHRKRKTRILEKEGNAYNITLAKTNTRPELSVNFTLPSYSYSILLVDTFINYHDGCFYFFNEGLVKRFLVNLYSGNTTENKKIIKRNIIPNAGPADAENTNKKDTDDETILETIWFCKILLIFAIGEMYLGTESDTQDKNYENKTVKAYACKSNKKREEAKKNTLPGSGFFYQASKLFTGLFASGAINTTTKDGGIEVMLLYAFYLQVADCTIASYFYFGLALRSALILGWHVDADMENQNRFELEHRRRIWWTVYMYERILSSKAGLPLSFADDSVSTELPFDFSVDLMDFPRDESDVRGYYVFPSSEYIINCVKITQINAVILSSLYTKQPTANILPVVSDLVQRLIRWKKALLESLRVDFSGEEVKISRLVVNLFTEYFQGINLAVRPLLFHFAAKKLKDLQSQGHINQYIDLSIYSKSVLLLLNASFQASINTIKCIWALLPQNMVALFGWMDREYLFTSASTLILFNASFGVHDATRVHLDHALTIFTRMKKLGNYPAALRRAQLLKLIEMLDFNGVKSDLPSKHVEATKAAPGERNAAQPENVLPLNSTHGAASFQSSEPVFSGTTVAPEPFRSDLNFLQFNNAVPSATGPSSSHHTPSISASENLTTEGLPTETPGKNFAAQNLANLSPANEPAISEMMGAQNSRCKHAPHSDFFSNEDWAGIEGFTYPDEELKLWNEITNDAVWLQLSGVPGTLLAGEEPVTGHDQSSFNPFSNLAGSYTDLISLELQNDMFS